MTGLFSGKIMFTGRVVTPVGGFLNSLQGLARQHQALTILDDCLMLRLAKGGSTEKFGLQPDLVVLGKFIGGGTPVGAVVGRKDLMDIFNPVKPGATFHGLPSVGHRELARWQMTLAPFPPA